MIVQNNYQLKFYIIGLTQLEEKLEVCCKNGETIFTTNPQFLLRLRQSYYKEFELVIILNYHIC